MDDQDLDWLDERLAAESYIPDHGFTARLMDSLPKRTTRAIKRRTLILFASGFAAVCLMAVQIIPLLQAVIQLVSGGTVDNVMEVVAMRLRQPAFLFECGAAVGLLSLASIPFLRRWA